MSLLAKARLLKNLATKKRSARREFEIERAVFLSVYIMRKLWEAGKLSSTWERRKIPCIFHQPKNRTPDRLNWHRIDELYNLDISESDPLRSIDFFHRLIHSYIFIPVEGSRRTLAGYFFASDHTKGRGLWFVRHVDLLKLLTETGRDYPSSMHTVRHPKTDEWVVWAGHGDPPYEWTSGANILRKGHEPKTQKNCHTK
jgi:hypothetical protein